MKSLSSQMTHFVISSPNRWKSIFCLLTIIAGIVILTPHLDYQPQLAQGDHGRDLYSYKTTFEGGIPYKDFSMQSGPLMPYYYSLLYHLFDVSIASTLLGYNLCILMSGLLIFLICSTYLDPLLSFCAALWYWAFRGTEFFYTYNHTGAIVMMLAAVYFLICYIKDSDKKYIYFGFVSIFILLLIRATIGLSTLAVIFIFLSIHNITSEDKKLKNDILKYFIIALGVSLNAFLIYWLLTKGLPRYISADDLAYWKYFRPKIYSQSALVLYGLTKSYFFSSIPRIIFTLTFFTAAISTAIKLNRAVSDVNYKKQLLTVLGLIFTLSIFNLGELFNRGIWFYAMWNLSLIPIMLFFIFNIGFCHLNRAMKTVIAALFLLIPLFGILQTNLFLAKVKQPSNKLSIGKNEIYVHPAQRPSIYTFTKATIFLMNQVNENERFLALPYDPIYYFLSDRESATRQLSILNFSEEKEQHLLNDIEKNKIGHILISNRAYRIADKRFGTLGGKYGIKLQQYINENFKEVAAFGPWEAQAGWTANHAVKIYRRK